jgi:LacI family transcriptional regulator, galactose operon repressor
MRLEIVHPQAYTYDGGVAATASVRACCATAAISYNGPVALGATQLAATGVAVPGDLSVIGVDGIAMASMSVPPCTTIAVPMDRAGRTSIEVMQPARRPAGGAGGVHTQLNVRGPTEAAHN